MTNDVIARLSDASKSHARIEEYRRKDTAIVFRPAKTMKVGEPGKLKEEEEIDSDAESEEDENNNERDTDIEEGDIER